MIMMKMGGGGRGDWEGRRGKGDEDYIPSIWEKLGTGDPTP